MMKPRLLLAMLVLQLAACAAPLDGGQTAQTPGWIGSTTVIGNNSTVADDAGATSDQQKWPRGRR